VPSNKDSGIDSYCSTEDGSVAPPVDSRYKHRVDQSAYDTGGDYCSGYGDLDEVFDNVPALVDQFQQNKITTVNFRDEIARLLHLYVLPSVRLTAENIPSLKRCLALQESNLQRIDTDILSRSDKCVEICQRRKRERSRFIDELVSNSSTPAFSEAFAEALFDDLSTDIAEASVILDTAQMAVDSSKLATVVGPPTECDGTLDKNRVERNDSHLERTRCLEAREAVREIRKASRSKLSRLKSQLRREGSVNSLHRIYVALKQQDAEMNAQVLALTNRKLLAISVKEAMRSALDELMRGVKDAYVVEVSPTGTRNDTDVLVTGSVSRDWQTLTQQVALILSDQVHPLSKKHFVFCRKCVERCNAATSRNRGNADALRLRNQTSSTDSVVSSTVGRQSNGDSASMLSEEGRSSVFTRSDSFVASSGSEIYPNNSRSISTKIKWPFKKKRSATFHSYISTASSPPSELFSGTTAVVPIIALDGSSIEASQSTSPQYSGIIFPEPPAFTGTQSCVTESVRDSASASTLEGSITDTVRPYSSHSIQSQLSVTSHADDLNKTEADGHANDGVRAVIDNLRTDIGVHFDTMCRGLQSEIGRTTHRHYNKIWVVYESHFYQATMNALSQLYALEYTSVTSCLCESVKTLTVVDLSLENAILTHILEDLITSNNVDESPTEKPVPVTNEVLAPTEYEKVPDDPQFASLLRKNHNRGVIHDGCDGISQPVKLSDGLGETCFDVVSISDEDRDFTRRVVSRHFRRTVTEGVKINRGQSLSVANVVHNDRLVPDVGGQVFEDESLNAEGQRTQHLTVDTNVPGLRRSSETVNGSTKDTATVDSVAILRRHLSSSNQSRLSTIRLSLTLQGPIPGVIVYERTLCPVRESLRLAAAADPTANPTTLFQSGSLPEEPEAELFRQIKTLRLKPHYRKQFAVASECIDNALKSRTPAAKLQYLSHCLREVSRQIAEFFTEINDGQYLGSSLSIY